jgi:hypothetical protein
MSGPLPRYTFLPWLRQGLAGSVQQVDSLGASSPAPERAAIDIAVRVNDAVDAKRRVALHGPGDVLSLDPGIIVRTDPRPDINDFEPNYFAAIELYDEDFPWRYTPAASTPENRLRPWIALVVLERGEFHRAPDTGPVKAIDLTVPATTVFPPANETWAWAHVHVNDDLLTDAGGSIPAAISLLQQRLASNPDVGISRLLCPRRLKPNTQYTAFLIPTFESGRRAGIGDPTPVADGLAPAWGAGQTRFPYYHFWRFGTGERGDFEYLVRLIQPRVLNPRVGIRDMDVQDPGMAMTGIAAPPALGLEGALKSLDTKSTVWTSRATFQNEVTALVNLPETVKQPGPHQDPIVAPPLYGRWYPPATLLRGSGNPPWIETLNLDPRTRVPAGFGTTVVQKNQERYVDEAWDQLGKSAALTANGALRRGQFSVLASERVHSAHIAALSSEGVLRVTSPVHQVILGSPTTIRYQIEQSAVPAAALEPAFRRITRPRGPLHRRMSSAAEGSLRDPHWIARLNSGEISAAPPYTAPTRVAMTDTLAEGLLPIRGLPSWLRRLIPDLHLLLVMILFVLFLAQFALGIVSWSLVTWVVLVAVTAAGYVVLERLVNQRWNAAEVLAPQALTVAAVDAVPPRPTFQIVDSATTPPNPGQGAADSAEARDFRRALRELHQHFETAPRPAPPGPRLAIAALRTRVLEALRPAETVPRRILARLSIPDIHTRAITRVDPLAELRWAPEIREPMYRPLREISPELLVPNLQLIPQNTIALMQTNQPFIEAYMVGLNHELARELLWREYPTEQRATFFRQFWDVKGLVLRDPRLSADEQREALYDIKPIHTWPQPSDLGEHNNRVTGSATMLVLTIRSDLLRKYPNTVISAVEATWIEEPKLTRRDLTTNEIHPLFRAEVPPDITFFGFNLTKEQVLGSPDPAQKKPGWFFVLKERPGEPRFALDLPLGPLQTAKSWDGLSWAHTGTNEGECLTLSKGLTSVFVTSNPDKVAWNANAADMAYITYQSPVLVAIHGDEMIADAPSV